MFKLNDDHNYSSNLNDIKIKQEPSFDIKYGCDEKDVINEENFNGTSDKISCVYNNKTAKTILITNNYSQSSTELSDTNKSSITIYTHNSDQESTAVTESSKGPVVVDRINICINNHYNKTVSPTVDQQQCSVDNKDMVKLSTVSNSSAELVQHTSPETKKSNDTTSPLKDSKRPQTQFIIGLDVLVEQKDGRYFLGTVDAVGRTQCLIKYGDNTKKWYSYHKLKHLSTGNSDGSPQCVICKTPDKSESVDECEKCGRGYHAKCVNEESKGICRRCSVLESDGLKFNNFTEPDPPSSNGNANVVIDNPSQLPYNINMLSWDKHHRVNLEQIYCYCGKNGQWDNKMLQCSCCKQWFHDNCVHSLKNPLFRGDRFFLFVCSSCNYGTEILRRLEMQMVHVIQLLLYNLTVLHSRKYYDLETEVVTFARKNSTKLQLTPKLKAVLSSPNLNAIILKILFKNPTLFKCASEVKRSTTLWGLRGRIPPIAPTVELPRLEKPYNDSIIDLHLKSVSGKFMGKQEKSENGVVGPRSKNTLNGVNANRKANGMFFKNKSFDDSKLTSKVDELNNDDSTEKPKARMLRLSLKRPKSEEKDESALKRRRLSPSLTSSQASNGSSSSTTDESARGQPIIRTVRRRLSARDILVGPNKEIKRRRVRRRSGNVEVISTATLETVTKSMAYLPIRSESKQWSVSAVRSVLSSVSSSSSNTPATTPTAGICPISLLFSKNPTQPDKSKLFNRDKERYVLSPSKSEVGHYLGATNRLNKDEHYVVKGKRYDANGKIQYLVEWEGVS